MSCDSFCDDELTMMADEIMRDLATKENLDPTASNPFHYLFASDDSECVDKLPSLSAISSVKTDEYMVYVNYPSMSPTSSKILSSSKGKLLAASDSFNQSIALPLIPPNNKKAVNATNGWCARKTAINNRPYITPPSLFIDEYSFNSFNSLTVSSNGVSACISPRHYTKKQTECHAQIPDFGDENESFIENIGICINHKHKNKHEKKKKKKRKKKKSAYTVKRVISPVSIDFDELFGPYNTDKKKACTDTEDEEIKKSMTPRLKRKNRNINRKNRAQSLDVNMDEYVIGFEHGFMFFNNK